MIITGHYCEGKRIKGYIVKYHPLLCSMCRMGSQIVEMEEEEIDKYNNKLKELWDEKRIKDEMTYEI